MHDAGSHHDDQNVDGCRCHGSDRGATDPHLREAELPEDQDEVDHKVGDDGGDGTEQGDLYLTD